MTMTIRKTGVSGRLAAIAGAAAMFAAGCASAPAAGPAPAAGSVSDACAGQAREALWAGTRTWQDGEGGPWTMTFRTTGTVVYSYDGTTYDNGRWTQDGDTLTFDFNDHYADYVGTVGGGKVAGTMKNTAGNSGVWSAERICG